MRSWPCGTLQLREAYDRLVAAYADRDEPEDPPLAVRVTTDRQMRGIIAETKAGGIELTEVEEEPLPSGLTRGLEK